VFPLVRLLLGYEHVLVHPHDRVGVDRVGNGRLLVVGPRPGRQGAQPTPDIPLDRGAPTTPAVSAHGITVLGNDGRAPQGDGQAAQHTRAYAHEKESLSGEFPSRCPTTPRGKPAEAGCDLSHPVRDMAMATDSSSTIGTNRPSPMMSAPMRTSG